MSVLAWKALRGVKNKSSCQVACRYIAGRRFSHPIRRGLHSSFAQLQEELTEQRKVVNGPPGDEPGVPPRKPRDPSFYGSASRRAGRNIKRVKEIPQVFIPSWFSDRNVILGSDAKGQGTRGGEAKAPENAEDAAARSISGESLEARFEAPSPDTSNEPAPESTDNYLAKYLKLNKHVIGEVLSLIQAGLRVPDFQSSDSVTSIKPHITLSCPRKGASSYLEGFIQDIARQRNIDILRLAPQDIAEIGGDYLDDPSSFRHGTMSSLGYEVAQIGALRPRPVAESEYEEEEYVENEEESDNAHQQPSRPLPQSPIPLGPNLGIIPAFVGSFKLEDIMKVLQNPKETPSDGEGQSSNSPNGKPVLQLRDNTPDMKMSMLVETLLNVPEMKRIVETHDGSQEIAHEAHNLSEIPSPEKSTPEVLQAQRGSNGLIIIIEDYHSMSMTVQGGKFLDKLHEVADTRRKEGQSVLLVGIASSESLLPSGNPKSAVDNVQNHPFGLVRNIVVPVKDKSHDGLLLAEHKRLTKQINLRHLRDMLRRIAPVQEQVGAIICDWDLDIESNWAFVSGLDRSIWPMDKVNRIATLALGLVDPTEIMSVKDIEKALEIMDASDGSKYKWYKKHFERKAKGTEDLVSAFNETQSETIEEKMQKLRKKCNSYEKKLLSGVVDAKNIRTTFADVQVAPETIEALKTLTSLSLVRPDAFTYGVLATDRIPGLLLYGPPGTGKTLLAKAVAKESNATVLEVSGSDVYDMYVGEGEKNVKAIFTLAKKLSPCIVFIDEADAILGSRSSGHSRTSHRELINQFLREWDGMTDMSAFIMVATNRPFDLDEASLRRLPRRLLVDLPVEKDREAILKIHLKEEILDPEVSMTLLASQTPFYSGSDLKNLCVAAALACVREEFDTAMAHNKDTPEDQYQYAKKRTLHQRHFVKAMEEISASISEDMGSLSAIRKFDEKYGDRRGRRKKLGGYGFKTVDDSEKLGSDAARVRN